MHTRSACDGPLHSSRSALWGALCLWLVLDPTSAAPCAERQAAPSGGLGELIDSAEAWARENLDEEVLDLLGEVDRARVEAWLGEIETRFQGTSLYELATSADVARGMVPFLEQWEETTPLAEWMKTRLDYLQVAEELRQASPMSPRPPRLPPNAPKSPTPAVPQSLAPPTLRIQRTLWARQFEKRPVPATARPYLARLKAAFAEERVPAELVWVAEVESSFNPTARSPVGAEGMFQLTKPTAQAYGLSTFLPDERKDPVKSARVAARHLRHLHERFGDWSLALAAYNAGERRVEGLLKGARTKEYSAIAHRLPAETQMYVPKCEAAVRRREGMSLDNLRLPRG
ncbi:MAG TPA: lytic transglycosylase [Verrucomicrobiales bacterium]|nr:lytic transglycosylase [Verrucomicrobiales bacterium]